jgi:mono/diheme cytochrome c family protein
MALDKKAAPGKRRRFPRSRLVLLTALVLSLFLFSRALTTPADEATPVHSTPLKGSLVLKGKRLYSDMRCYYCHSLKGRGGTVGPPLDNVGFRRTREWMAHHFRNPQEVTPGTKMIKLKLKESQIAALVDYMNSLGGYIFTPQAAGLFQQYCADCHSLTGPQGSANDLSQEGKYRDIYFLMDYISDPAQLNAQTKMKGFKDVLTLSQIKDIASFLYLQGR